jgi:1,4-dihydroxy-2-naphthoyl-CoA hydrolase
MSFIYRRTIRFQDTDAAGVVYFANVLSICHEAYEASLAESGINLKTFFGKAPIAFPIVHASLDLRSPLFCGETYDVLMTPVQLGVGKFEIRYEIGIGAASEGRANQAQTIHVAIDAVSRRRAELPADLLSWLRRWQPGWESGWEPGREPIES